MCNAEASNVLYNRFGEKTNDRINFLSRNWDRIHKNNLLSKDRVVPFKTHRADLLSKVEVNLFVLIFGR